MGFAQTFSKYILGVFNVIFFLASLLLIVLGIWIKVDKSNVHRVLAMVKFDGGVHLQPGQSSPLVDIMAISMIIVGVLVLITSFCGCCGAWKENKILLYSYLFILAIIVVLEISLIILVAVKKNKIHDALKDNFKRILIRDYNGIASDNSTFFTKTFGALMIKLKCCGISGREDFDTIKAWKSSVKGKDLENPIPCCKFKPDYRFSVQNPGNLSTILDNLEDKECMTDANSNSINKLGCADVLWGIIVSKMKILIGIIAAVAIFEVACLIFACCIIHKSYETIK